MTSDSVSTGVTGHCPRAAASPAHRDAYPRTTGIGLLKYRFIMHSTKSVGDAMSKAHYESHGDIAVIRLDNPPVNGLGYELRRGIVDGIETAEADNAVKAVVIIGSDKAFSGGADIKEFGTPQVMAEPVLPTVINVIETSAKPVIAAISGHCLGGRLELAMGCHFRIAKGDAKLALPEVKLGLLPGAGGTQRLPRLIGLEHALNMIVSGADIPAAMFKGTPLIHEIVEGDLQEQAIAFARKVVTEQTPIKLARDLKVEHPNPEGFLLWAKNAEIGRASCRERAE